jgi:hypothetical protein
MGMPERTALESVAEHFSLADGQIALEVATVKQSETRWATRSKPRLRFDKVALRLVARLRDSLQDAVPDGETLVFTITAPIRMWTKTASVLEEAIRDGLGRQSSFSNNKHAIHNNHIEVRLVKHGLIGASKVAGFVHNPESEPALIFDMTSSLIECIGAAGVRAPTKDVRERWLVLANEDGPPHIEAFRAIYAQLFIPNDFKRILMVFAEGRVEGLAESR